MAKTKPSKKEQGRRDKQEVIRHLDKVLPDRPSSKQSSKTKESVEELLVQASALLEVSQPEEALPIASRALKRVRKADDGLTIKALPALNLVAEINLELGDADRAREYFSQAFELDPNCSIPESQGGGVEKLLWLAQLSEAGGQDSVLWFEKAIVILRNQIALTLDSDLKVQTNKKLAAALCSVIEIYMTDLSWDPDAEARCESLITEAILVAPETPETMQTLASVRISQTRVEEAKKALTDSLEIWKHLPAGDEGVPDFSTRISLARLLMEAELEDEAMEVLERLVEEDDTSVEAWYLGGWCSYLLAEQAKATQALEANGTGISNAKEFTHEASLRTSRDWLRNSLRLYDLQDYEDDRLRAHAMELVHDRDAELGDTKDDDEEDGAEGEGWESDIEDEDHEMDTT
ncbi:MAG: hypothetical protein Q9166_004833 [cf. Caloplaca sp. 2 TL-2023]